MGSALSLYLTVQGPWPFAKMRKIPKMSCKIQPAIQPAAKVFPTLYIWGAARVFHLILLCTDQCITEPRLKPRKPLGLVPARHFFSCLLGYYSGLFETHWFISLTSIMTLQYTTVTSLTPVMVVFLAVNLFSRLIFLTFAVEINRKQQDMCCYNVLWVCFAFTTHYILSSNFLQPC